MRSTSFRYVLRRCRDLTAAVQAFDKRIYQNERRRIETRLIHISGRIRRIAPDPVIPGNEEAKAALLERCVALLDLIDIAVAEAVSEKLPTVEASLIDMDDQPPSTSAEAPPVARSTVAELDQESGEERDDDEPQHGAQALSRRESNVVPEANSTFENRIRQLVDSDAQPPRSNVVQASSHQPYQPLYQPVSAVPAAELSCAESAF